MRHPYRYETLRLPGPDEVVAPLSEEGVVAGHSVERTGLFTVIPHVGGPRRDRGHATAAALVVLDQYEALGLVERKWLQQKRAHDAEDCGARTDSKPDD